MDWTPLWIFLAVAGVFGIIVAIAALASSSGAVASALGSVALLAGPSMVSVTACPASVDTTLTLELETMRTRLRSAAERLPAIEWPVFAASGTQYAGRRVLLRQAHAANGTIRIRAPCMLQLAEDIIFSPRAENDYRPMPADIGGNLAFRLGFFAAISIEAPSVVVDLNGHTLAQSVEHALQQRAPFSLIELANVPFIPGEGPTLFGQTVVSADGCVIENGRLGRSAHHAIHGNSARRVLIRSVIAEQYEVAAISLHGVRDVLVDRVRALGQATTIPVIGTYSNARQLVPMVERALALGSEIGAQKRLDLEEKLDVLTTLMQQAFNDVRTLGRINNATHPAAHALFANVHGVPDGNSYSFVLHSRGAAVTNFKSGAPDSATMSQRVHVRDSTFANTRAHIIEVVGLQCPDGTMVRGPVGALLRMIDNDNRIRLFDPATGAYQGNALADLQVSLMDAALDITNTSRRAALFGTLHGPEPIVQWARGQLTLAQLVDEHGFTYKRNGDTMFHVNKGTTSFRVDASRDVCVTRVRVTESCNTGKPGVYAPLPGEPNAHAAAYVSAADGGHPAQGKQYGYGGADTRAVSLAGAAYVYVHALTVDSVHAYRGFSRGIDIFNGAEHIYFGPQCSVNNVTSLIVNSDDILIGNYAIGPKVGAAIGVHVSDTCTASTYGALGVQVTRIVSGAFDQNHVRSIGTDQELADVEEIHANVYDM